MGLGLECLPDEITWNILARVPTLDLIRNCQCVCKKWKSIIEEPSFHRFQSSCSFSNPSNRVLVLPHPHPQGETLFLFGLPDMDIDKTRVVKRELVCPRLEQSGPVISHNGLICYMDEFKRITIMNPFTNQRVLLPGVDDPESRNFVDACGFLYDPTTNFYKVMVFREQMEVPSQATIPRLTEFMIFDSGSKRWRSMGEPAFFVIRRSSQVLVNERLHWIASIQGMGWDIIVSFDLINEYFSTIRLPPPHLSLEYRHQLMAFDGKLCILKTDVLGKTLHQRIWVMKDYGIEESWTNMFNIQHTIPLEVRPSGLYVEFLGDLDNDKVLLQSNEGTLFFYDLRCQNYWLLRLPLPIESWEKKWSLELPMDTLEDMIASIHFASLCNITASLCNITLGF